MKDEQDSTAKNAKVAKKTLKLFFLCETFAYFVPLAVNLFSEQDQHGVVGVTNRAVNDEDLCVERTIGYLSRHDRELTIRQYTSEFAKSKTNFKRKFIVGMSG